MKIAVANTDYAWYTFLRDRAVAREAEGERLEEVNFWRPSSKQGFRMLQPGEPFLFKLKAPRNVIAGGGFFLNSHKQLPLKLAWDAFADANGAADLETLRRMIADYRREGAVTDYGTRIGCILITQPVFFPEAAWIPTPHDWSPNIVAYKGYDTDDAIGAELWERARPLLAAPFAHGDRLGETSIPIERMFGDARPVRPRLGQGSFRTMVTENYEYRCAVTGGKILPVLEAAHIRPVTREGRHDIRNGVLLRSDVHTLFDKGFVTITPQHVFRTSSALRDEFNNGEEYRRLEGQRVWVPGQVERAPDARLLEWHGDTVFVP
jgi:putative restriction endonuclease